MSVRIHRKARGTTEALRAAKMKYAEHSKLVEASGHIEIVLDFLARVEDLGYELMTYDLDDGWVAPENGYEDIALDVFGVNPGELARERAQIESEG